MTVTINPRAKKANREKAFSLVLRLKKGEQLTSDELDSLLRFFTGSRAPKKLKTPLDWLKLPKPKKKCFDMRGITRCIIATEEYAASTDGKRLHIVYNPGLEPGFYDKETLLHTCDYVPVNRDVAEGDINFVIDRYSQYLLPAEAGSIVVDEGTEYREFIAGNKVYIPEKQYKEALLIGSFENMQTYVSDNAVVIRSESGKYIAVVALSKLK